MKKKLWLLLFIGLIGFLPISIESATIFEDNFNDYTDGALHGQGSWDQTAGGTTFTVQDSIIYEGTKAVSVGSGANDDTIKKTGTEQGDGRLTFYIYPTNSGNYESTIIGLYSGASVAYWFSFESGTAYTPTFYHGSHTLLPDTYNPDEWNMGEIEWRSSDNKARARINEGTWTDWVSGWNPWTTLDTISFETGGNHTGYTTYFDTLLEDPYEEPPEESTSTESSLITDPNVYPKIFAFSGIIFLTTLGIMIKI